MSQICAAYDKDMQHGNPASPRPADLLENFRNCVTVMVFAGQINRGRYNSTYASRPLSRKGCNFENDGVWWFCHCQPVFHLPW